MKTSRRLIMPLAILLLAVLSFPIQGAEYSGSFFEWTGVGTFTNRVYVSQVATVSNLSVLISNAQTSRGFENNAMILTSPLGTTCYLFNQSVNPISGTSLFLTRFMDAAPIPITDGVPPYAGSFQPENPFSVFSGQWMTGTWSLSVYNQLPGRSNEGAVTDWSLILNQSTPVPTPTVTPTPTSNPTPSATPYAHCPIYPGQPFTLDAFSVVTKSISISSPHRVGKVLVNIENFSTDISTGLENVGMYLISPRETVVALFEKHMLEESAMGGTWFNDSAARNIAAGMAPYAGHFRPTEKLSDFVGEPIAGEWKLLVLNDTSFPAQMEEWALEICEAEPTPTPLPLTPTPTITPLVFCRDYLGSAFEWSDTGQMVSEISVGHNGYVSKAEVMVNINCSAGLDNLGVYLVSPEGTSVGLFKEKDLLGNVMYQTVFDDESLKGIKTGSAPYVGRYAPVEALATVNNEPGEGNWKLLVYNSSSLNIGKVSSWQLRLCLAGSAPTPTPAPTPYTHCPIYPGQPFTVLPFSVTTDTIPLDSPHRVGKILVNIENFSVGEFNDLDNVGMYLISPQEIVVPLFEKHMLAEHALAGTWFDDSSDKNIAEGIGPYVGPFRPTGKLSDFVGRPIEVEWKLLVFNDGESSSGRMKEWALEICEADPTPTPPPVTPTPTVTPLSFCRDYLGSAIEWSEMGYMVSEIPVGHHGDVSKAEVMVNINSFAGLDNLGVYLVSPEETYVGLFEGDDLLGHVMYRTVFDDESLKGIKTGVAPYVGRYAPVNTLATVNGEPGAGIWKLLVYNSSSLNIGEVSSWKLRLCLEESAPTPTSTPSPTSTLTPTPTATLPPTPRPPIPTPSSVCPIYPGNTFRVKGQKVYTDGNEVVAPEKYVEKVTLRVNNFHITQEGDLDHIGMWLISPDETVVELFPKHQLGEHALFGTWFDDSAPREITEGLGPYLGRWRPTGRLSDFYGKAIDGIWQLVVFNDFVCKQEPDAPPCEDWAEMSERWELMICPQPPTPSPAPTTTTPTPTPPGYKTPTPQPVSCADYIGESFTLENVGTETGELIIPAYGSISKLTVRLTVRSSDDLDNVGIYLRGPDSTDVPLFEKHELSEHALYRTIFDDAAQKLITAPQNVSPYLGSYRTSKYSTKPLSIFNSKLINGTWALIVYNDLASNKVEIEDWMLTICKVPTPAPTTTPRLPITPPPPPTPIAVLDFGDYNGDGTSDIGVFRPDSGLWSVRGVGTSFFGQPGDVPASGDYDGDGTADMALFRPSATLWAVYGITRVYFGQSGDTPVPGDYTGDGWTDIGIFRSTPGLWSVRDITRIYFGAAGDIPVPGDYTGDGFADPAVFRPSAGLWAINGGGRIYFGNPGDIPLARDFTGDGTADLAIFRASSGLWAIRGLTRFYFGSSGDYPVAADFLGNWQDYPGIYRKSSGLWAVRGVTRVYYGDPGNIPIAR